jgi:hypothetical protein
MLRRKSPSDSTAAAQPPAKDLVLYPDLAAPFVLGYAPVGVHFYRPKEAFYLPYASLQAMRLDGELLTLSFATDEVVIEGRGLHSLYAHLAEQKVKRVQEQGERYEQVDDGGTFIRSIERRLR